MRAGLLQAGAAAPDPDLVELPPLRQDLKLVPGPRLQDGSPTWTIQDPVRNRYHRLTQVAFDLVARWDAGTVGAVRRRLQAETGQTVEAAVVLDLLRTLRSGGLVVQHAQNDAQGWLAQSAAARQNWATWLLHHYLFFRIPLVRPERFLSRTYPSIAWLYSRRVFLALLAIFALGLYLVARQWDVFLTSFVQFASWQGMFWTAVTLVGTKLLHELGHAYTAHRYGCRVPTMGVAFLVLFPVLYTDTSDTWKLTSRQERLAVGAAGVAAELALAAVATLLWSFLPDGGARNAVFIVATASWVTTLGINLNPFMRFDGYYLLSDLWDVPNLQPRAFALGRWRLREALFGLHLAPPEPLPPGLRRRMIVYAYATWIYRLVLFLGIAMLVYHFFIKVVGLFLFAVEIVWFIARPVWTEMKEWARLRDAIRPNINLLASLFILLGTVLVVTVPWQSSVRLPALVQARSTATIHAPVAGRIEAVMVAEGQRVAKGDPLIRVRSDDIDQEIRTAEWSAVIARLQAVQAGAGAVRLEDRLILAADLLKAERELEALRAEAARLLLRAPAEGVVTDLARGLRPGLWVTPDIALARVVAIENVRILAYAEEEQVVRLAPGTPIRFHADDPQAPVLAGRVTDVETVHVARLEDRILATSEDGPIAVKAQKDGSLIPVRTLYRIHAEVDEPQAEVPRVLRGFARAEAEPVSLLEKLWKPAAAVLIRESGF